MCLREKEQASAKATVKSMAVARANAIAKAQASVLAEGGSNGEREGDAGKYV